VALQIRKRTFQILISAGLVTFAASLVFIRGAGLFTFDDKSPTEVASPLPESLANVLAPTDALSPDEVRTARPWQKPDFSAQEASLGWKEDTFDIPDSMRKRVDFWKDVYSKYSTDQGVLHDPVTLGVYESVQFEPLKPGALLSASGRARQRSVDEKKAIISSHLLILQKRLDEFRLSALTTPFIDEPLPTPAPSTLLGAMTNGSELTGVDLRYWKLFEKDNDPNKFRKAASRIRFQLGQRDKFYLGIYFSGRYLTEMEKVFREEGLPIELTRLPFVESSFNTRARSKVGASGIWQFMPRTARPYMKVNSSIDERNDPLLSTRAAARLMKNNFSMLHSWPLAVTAWNHGPSGVRNIVEKFRTMEIGKIVNGYSSRTFGFASQNFYACFLAVLEVEANATTYFSDPVWQAPIEFAEFKTSGQLIAWPQVVKVFGDNEVLAQDFNPQLTAHARSSKPRIPSGTTIRIPKDASDLAATLFSKKKKPRSGVVKAAAPSAVPSATPAASSSSAPISEPVVTPAVTPTATSSPNETGTPETSPTAN
jgi:hypothetical protein